MKPLLRRVLLGVSALCVALLLALAVLWVWLGSDTSLSSALAQVPRWLPAGQSLEVRDVQGSLLKGGRIGWLRWQQGGLRVEATQVALRWDSAALMRRALHVDELTVAQLLIDDQRPSAPEAPVAVPTSLALPLSVTLNARIDAIDWAGKSQQHFGALGFLYSFDSYQHRIEKGYAHILSNKFDFSGQLQAHDEMALALQLSGSVSAPVPGSTLSVTVPAQAELKGRLAGQDAQVTLQASLQPQLATQRGATGAMQAQISAQLAPWHKQKIIQANGQWQGLNLAALWPALPQTQLDGRLAVLPQGSDWQANTQVRNHLAGPLDKQRLPVQHLDARFDYTHDLWLLQSLQLRLGGARLVGQAQAQPTGNTPAQSSWRAQVRVHDLNPEDLDSRLPADRIDGQINAQHDAHDIAFEVALQGRAILDDESATRLNMTGRWATPRLSLSALRLDAGAAHLHGQLDIHTQQQSAQGKLTLAVPGLSASVDGQLGRTEGAGNATLDVSDAGGLMRWLARWPMVSKALAASSASGHAQLQAQWRGGWQNQGQALSLKAQLRSPQLDWQWSGSAPESKPSAGRSRNLSLEGSGTLASFNLQGSGGLDLAANQFDWQTQLQASQTPAGDWQAQVQQLGVKLRLGPTQQKWQLALEAPSRPVDARQAGTPPGLALRWSSVPERRTLDISAGSVRITSAHAGESQVQWQPLRWAQPLPRTSADESAAPAQWQSSGHIVNLPVAWLDLLGSKTLAEMGLGSDMVLSGQWEAGQAQSLHASLLLERSQGDLRLLPGTVAEQAVAAGMRETRLQINLDGDRLAANLRWDSQRAGRALLAFSTQLQQQSGAWQLPGSAPVGGSLQLDLPPMEAWSALAPPGWRLRGTMAAHVNLEGTLDRPQWSGEIQAQDLAVRSLVDGIDFSQGRLSARLHDQQLDLTRLSLRGAGAAAGKNSGNTQGGELILTGSARLLPIGQPGGERLQVQLQAQAQALRVSARPDRRVTVSGQLGADLTSTRLTLRGALKADQALFTLPDSSTPRLGSDVVVRGGSRAQRGASAAPAPAAAKPAGDKPPILGLDLQVELDPGDDFQVRGMGVQTRLAGKLKLNATTLAQPNVNGTLRAVGGTYRAYGQRLDIERGLIRFNGAYDNPALTVLAIRPKLTQRVGVQITGTALAPIVTLYAEPDLPEAEKLGWLLLGRSPTGGGAETAVLQQAAMALLDKTGQGLTDGLTAALGLDEISFSSNASNVEGSSETNTASITLGKRLSKDFYVAYESSINGALGVLHIFYDLSKNLTLRAQTGQQSAVDLIYTLRYD